MIRGQQPTLEELATRRFGALTEAEKKLFHAATSGKHAYCGPDDKGPHDQENIAAHGWRWGNSREIRAEMIAWLCSDSVANNLVHERGLTIACAKIVGTLDLTALDVRFPLIFVQCCLGEIRSAVPDYPTHQSASLNIVRLGSGAVMTSVISIASTHRLNTAPYEASRSRNRKRGAVSHRNASVT
jgi:hypothetical protein